MPDPHPAQRRRNGKRQRNHPGGREGRAGAHARLPRARAGGGATGVRAGHSRQRQCLAEFGAGHTSFRNLRKLGVDILKIDGSFVPNIAKSNDDRAFVRTLVDLSRRLGLKSVAEWVQDEQIAALLTEWGCDYLQGQLIGLAASERPWVAKEKQASA